MKSTQFIPTYTFIYTYCFNKHLLRYTTETLREKRTETCERRGEILFSTDISFSANVECHFHSNFVLLNILLWPFLKRGREKSTKSWDTHFYKCLRIRCFNMFYGKSCQTIAFSKEYALYFLLKVHITCTV